MLKFIAQLVFIVAASVSSWLLFGHAMYITIGSVIAVIVLVIFMTRSQWGDARIAPDPDEIELPAVALEFFYRFMLSLLLGVFWPSLPFIFAYGKARDAAKTGAPTPPQPR